MPYDMITMQSDVHALRFTKWAVALVWLFTVTCSTTDECERLHALKTVLTKGEIHINTMGRLLEKAISGEVGARAMYPTKDSISFGYHNPKMIEFSYAKFAQKGGGMLDSISHEQRVEFIALMRSLVALNVRRIEYDGRLGEYVYSVDDHNKSGMKEIFKVHALGKEVRSVDGDLDRRYLIDCRSGDYVLSHRDEDWL